jgi:hypothetical protein
MTPPNEKFERKFDVVRSLSYNLSAFHPTPTNKFGRAGGFVQTRKLILLK